MLDSKGKQSSVKIGSAYFAQTWAYIPVNVDGAGCNAVERGAGGGRASRIPEAYLRGSGQTRGMFSQVWSSVF